MGKAEEKHITVTPEIHSKLQNIAVSERRSMRAVVSKWIEDAHKNLKGGK